MKLLKGFLLSLKSYLITPFRVEVFSVLRRGIGFLNLRALFPFLKLV